MPSARREDAEHHDETTTTRLLRPRADLAPHYIFEVRRDGALDHLEVIVELDPLAANVAIVRDEAARDLQHRIKGVHRGDRVGIGARCGSLERSVGKAKRVFDKRNEAYPPLVV